MLTYKRLASLDDAYEPVPIRLMESITGRRGSMFNSDVAFAKDNIRAAIEGKRVLVVGAAGSIGSVVTKTLIDFGPAHLALVDISENALADMVRVIQADEIILPRGFQTSVVEAGTVGFDRFFETCGPFDLVLNFAALKHVRSERDPFSLMRLLETNVFATKKLVDLVAETGGRLFSVSSDKAVRPGNLMGASKRWMELLLRSENIHATSARFANVAFSAGSLLRSFGSRVLSRQPIGAPNDVARYFMSHREAAELCVLAATLGRPGEVFLPKLDPQSNLLKMDVAAERFLGFLDLIPEIHVSAESAKRSAHLLKAQPQFWPCVFSPSNTAGEKPFEEFHYDHEDVDRNRFGAIDVALIDRPNESHIANCMAELQKLKQKSNWNKAEIAGIIASAVPEMAHVDSEHSLDEKL